MVRILAEVLTIGNGILNAWVDMPANALGPLDPSATVTVSASDLVTYLASSAVIASDILSVVTNALF
jgi:hypothetical protein